MDNLGYVFSDDYIKGLKNEETFPVTKSGRRWHPPTDKLGAWRATYAIDISINILLLISLFSGAGRQTSVFLQPGSCWRKWRKLFTVLVAPKYFLAFSCIFFQIQFFPIKSGFPFFM